MIKMADQHNMQTPNGTKDKGTKKFTEKHAELWKFIKFSIAGGGSSAVELVVHMVLLTTVFASMTGEPVTNKVLQFLNMESKGYLYAYFISTTIGYAIAFILNRKITFHADSNATVSIVIYIVMVIFTIFANTWIGTVISDFIMAKGWNNNWTDLLLKVIVMVIPTLWTYPMNRFVIHRKKVS